MAVAWASAPLSPQPAPQFSSRGALAQGRTSGREKPLSATRPSTLRGSSAWRQRSAPACPPPGQSSS
eukprot:14105773-Alexandrium_andersonii.AAC.1